MQDNSLSTFWRFRIAGRQTGELQIAKSMKYEPKGAQFLGHFSSLLSIWQRRRFCLPRFLRRVQTLRQKQNPVDPNQIGKASSFQIPIHLKVQFLILSVLFFFLSFFSFFLIINFLDNFYFCFDPQFLVKPKRKKYKFIYNFLNKHFLDIFQIFLSFSLVF